MTYYKVLNNGTSPYAGYDYSEYLPKYGKPGKWLPKVKTLVLCETGYHVTDAEHLIDWIDGNQLFEVEVKMKVLKGDNKTTCQQIRLVKQVEGWNDKNLRLFAYWCAEQVLPIYEAEYPDDYRPRNAIETAKRYVECLATEEELSAAMDAAWAAAAAAMDAAWAAAAAASAAARHAARHAASAAARYAAWDAASAAAWAAADAARYAAWDAAWAAAWAAARDDQESQLLAMVEEARNGKTEWIF